MGGLLISSVSNGLNTSISIQSQKLRGLDVFLLSIDTAVILRFNLLISARSIILFRSVYLRTRHTSFNRLMVILRR